MNRSCNTEKKLKRDGFVGWHFLKMFNSLSMIPSKEEVVVSIVLATGTEVGFMTQAAYVKNQPYFTSWMSPNSEKLKEMAVWEGSWADGKYEMDMCLTTHPEKHIVIMCIASGDDMIISIWCESTEHVKKVPSSCLCMGSIVISKKLRKNKIPNILRNFFIIKEKLKGEIFLPLRDKMYQESGTNCAYPSLFGMPTEMLFKIMSYLPNNDKNRLKMTSRRFRDLY